jgi:hypothetical protein
VVDPHFQACTNECGLEVSAPRFIVRKGAPLSESTTSCLEGVRKVLIATCLPILGCSAMYTAPIPPSPKERMI